MTHGQSYVQQNTCFGHCVRGNGRAIDAPAYLNCLEAMRKKLIDELVAQARNQHWSSYGREPH